MTRLLILDIINGISFAAGCYVFTFLMFAATP